MLFSSSLNRQGDPLISTHLLSATVDGGDACWVHQGLGSFGGLLDQTLPLSREPCEFLFLLVKSSVHTVLKVGGCGDFYTLLLLSKHSD